MVGSEPHYARRAPERGLGRRLVAAGEIQQQVAGNVLVQQRRAARERRARIDHRGQLAVFDRHRFGGVLRGRRAFSHHQRDRLADIAHAPLGQRRPHGRQLLGPAATLHRRCRGQRPQSRCRYVGAGQDGDHARHGERGGGIQRRDFRVRTVRAQEMPAGLPGQVPVGDVTPAAFEHALVFEPALVAEWLHSRGL